MIYNPEGHQGEKGYFKLELVGLSEDKILTVRVSCKSDPGYSGTALMIAESAVCLALDEELLPQNFGILTPATTMGDTLINRLKKAGMKFEIVDENSKTIV